MSNADLQLSIFWNSYSFLLQHYQMTQQSHRLTLSTTTIMATTASGKAFAQQSKRLSLTTITIMTTTPLEKTLQKMNHDHVMQDNICLYWAKCHIGT